MGFRMEHLGDVAVVSLDRQLIVENRGQLKRKVLERLHDGDRKFVLDFSRTRSVDSSGLGVLVSLAKEVQEEGGALYLSNLSQDLRMLFHVTRIEALVNICESREEALRVL